jgi:hypothetical protein
MWCIILLSAAIALSAATAAGGIAGTLLTCCELLIPVAYSVPPVRTKTRGWLGILCDALAAHVYPALLAFLVLSHRQVAAVTLLQFVAGTLWALMAGLRGILSHQLQSEQQDRTAGLLTVVHRVGHARLARIVTCAILPVEVTSFAVFVSQCDVGRLFCFVAVMFLLYELVKSALNPFPVIVFTRAGQHYIPLVDEGAYKVWCPMACLLDAGLKDPIFFILLPIYVVLFRPRIYGEWCQMKLTYRTLTARIAE